MKTRRTRRTVEDEEEYCKGVEANKHHDGGQAGHHFVDYKPCAHAAALGHKLNV